MHKNIILILLLICSINAFSQQDTTFVDTLAKPKISKDTLLNDTTKYTSIIMKDTIEIIGVGDIMLGTNFPSVSYLPPHNNCEPLLANVKDILQGADITVGNLEGCFSDTAPLVKRCKDSTKCYAFRMPIKYAQCLKDAGFDVLTLANNHSGDFGDLGRTTTVNLLNELGIIHAGWLKYPYTTFVRDSITYGVVSFSPNSGTLSINDTIKAKEIVRSLKQKSDIVIVTFHGGAEGSKYQHVTRETEMFYGENRGNVYKFARTVIDAGADIVFGHGPHVSRAIDLYKNRFIAYSLGNFCTYARFNLSGANGIAPILKIKINKKGEFLSGKIISAKQMGEGGTYPDKQQKAVKIIKTLTEVDIPESPIKIDNNGFIYKVTSKK